MNQFGKMSKYDYENLKLQYTDKNVVNKLNSNLVEDLKINFPKIDTKINNPQIKKENEKNEFIIYSKKSYDLFGEEEKNITHNNPFINNENLFKNRKLCDIRKNEQEGSYHDLIKFNLGIIKNDNWGSTINNLYNYDSNINFNKNNLPKLDHNINRFDDNIKKKTLKSHSIKLPRTRIKSKT